MTNSNLARHGLRSFVAGILLFHCIESALFENGVTAASREPSDEIDSLIDLLESPDYATREKATQQLVELDGQAIEPMALRYHDLGPESAWRIKRALKGIATQSLEEENSLRSVAMILALDRTVDLELAGLLVTWRENRSARAVEHLVQRGARTGLHRNPIQVAALLNQIESFNQDVFRSSNAGLSGSDKTNSPLDEGDLRSQIEKLASAPITDVQKFVFQRLPKIPEANPTSELVFVNGLANLQSTNAIYLEIGPNWTGTVEDLAWINEIHNLRSLQIKDQNLNADELKIVSQLSSLTHLELSNTRFEKSTIQNLELPRTIHSITLAQQKLDRPMTNWLSEQPIDRLSIDGCDLDSRFVEKLADFESLQFLELSQLHLDSEFFNAMLKASNLERVLMTACKFRLEDYREFAVVRPRLINFLPRSFLGVQGRRDTGTANSYTCEIELVVADSAAAKAGIQVGDVITAVNGERITSFEELRMFISQHDAGEKMQVSIDRLGEQLDLQVILGTN